MQAQAAYALTKKLNKMRSEGNDVPWKAKELIDAFMKKHKALEEFFCTSFGLELQRMDSDIVDKILTMSVEQNIPVLPIHDSFVVRQSDKQKLLDMMVSEYCEVMGFSSVVHAA